MINMAKAKKTSKAAPKAAKEDVAPVVEAKEVEKTANPVDLKPKAVEAPKPITKKVDLFEEMTNKVYSGDKALAQKVVDNFMKKAINSVK